jgi:hypothetical protein
MRNGNTRLFLPCLAGELGGVIECSLLTTGSGIGIGTLSPFGSGIVKAALSMAELLALILE